MPPAAAAPAAEPCLGPRLAGPATAPSLGARRPVLPPPAGRTLAHRPLATRLRTPAPVGVDRTRPAGCGRARGAAFAVLLAAGLLLPLAVVAQTPEVGTASEVGTAPAAGAAQSASDAEPSAGAGAAGPAIDAVDPAAPAAAAPADPGSPTAAPEPAPAMTARAHLPQDLSPWGMFVASDWVVKAVMIGLAFASVVTWTVALVKSFELAAAGRRLRRDRAALTAAAGLAPAAELPLGTEAAALVDAAVEEGRLSAGLSAAGIKERVASRLDRVEAAVARTLRRGTGALATIGATAPFVGLFGTVWGIMNAFIGISEAQTTNLAVVAPGIAEALLATAIGLVAAIPAVVLYNHFARRIADRRQALADVSAVVMRLVSRDLDRRVARGLAAAAE